MTRAIPKLQPGLFDELIIDNFAGGGGASTGIEMALGRAVDIAINHDGEAVAMHMANHPYTTHYCEDVWTVDPCQIVKGRPVGLAWFSPDCKHFSKAKGGKPVARKIRGLAWVVVRYAQKVRPRVIMLENVEEFQDWGPLVHVCDDSGHKKMDVAGHPVMMPCGVNKGKTFYLWVSRLERLGYRVEWKELRACDYGAPTIRKRLFLVARCDGLPIVWPEPTHGDPKSEAVKKGKLQPWRTAADCIDWSIPAPSIFERKRPLADATMRRIAKGIMRYVVNNPDPFIVPLTHHGERRTNDINEPLPTITAAHRGELAMVVPVCTEHANASSPRCMPADEPLRTICASTKGGHHALIEAFLAKHNGKSVGSGTDEPATTITGKSKDSLVTAHLVRQFGQSVGSSPVDPVGTITSGGLGKTGLVTSHLVKLRGTCRDGQEVTRPMPTITASGTHVGEVRAFLLKYYGSDQDPQLLDPLHTITTKDRFGLVTVSGEQYRIVDIGLRMLSPRELFRAQGFDDSYIIDLLYNGKPLTKTAQVRMCGNSVSQYPAAALVRANVQIQSARMVV
ncbi:MAG: DNA cytosine methyltransferase [Desulfocapsaceae bacterium]|nr:DNA cytosine methyltransferase [Desulfocapsaceae bacterium]